MTVAKLVTGKTDEPVTSAELTGWQVFFEVETEKQADAKEAARVERSIDG